VQIEDDINKKLLNIYDKYYKNSFDKYVTEIDSNSWVEKIFLKDIVFDESLEIFKEIKELEFKNKNHKCLMQRFKLNSFYDFIINNRLILLKLLEYRIENNHSTHTIMSDLVFMTNIFKFLINIKPNEKVRALYLKYSKLMTEYDLIIVKHKEMENKCNKLEINKFIKFDQILKIKDNIKDSNYKNHVLKLLISLYILTPPLRNEILSMTFIFDKNHDNLIDDFILILNDVYFILNTIKKGHKKIQYKLENEELKNLIKESYKKYPRKFVITSLKNKDINVHEGLKRDYFQLIHPDLGINNIRSSYFTFWREKYKNFYEFKVDIEKSRTSIENVLTYYIKNDQ
jgi:hypothetical protein